MRPLLAIFFQILLFSSLSLAQSDITSRRVQSEGNQILVNQVETDDFPKVSIFVTVLKDGIPVKGLAENDFTVTEDEVEQEPLTVVPKLSPLSTVMTLDVSGSMRKRMDDAKVAAKEFVNALKSEDKVQAMTFARKVKKLSELSTQHGKIKDAIDGTVARGDTALYDAIYESVAALKGVEGRKAIIVLSDGIDDDGTGGQLSKKSIAEALELAQEINVPIYTIGLGTKLDETTLRNVANSTGGLYFNAPKASQLKELYAQIGQQLSGQYNIYYNSNLPGDASLHKVKITSGGLAAYKAYKSPLLKADNSTLKSIKDPNPIKDLEPTNTPLPLNDVTLEKTQAIQTISKVKSGKLIFNWLGDDGWEIYRGDTRVNNHRGKSRQTLQAGTYTTEVSQFLSGINISKY